MTDSPDHEKPQEKRDPTPHDASYKSIFSNPEVVKDLFSGFIHQDWTAKMDYSSLELQNASFVTDDLGPRISDLVWKVSVGEESVYVYLLMEFQSESDP